MMTPCGKRTTHDFGEHNLDACRNCGMSRNFAIDHNVADCPVVVMCDLISDAVQGRYTYWYENGRGFSIKPSGGILQIRCDDDDAQDLCDLHHIDVRSAAYAAIRFVAEYQRPPMQTWSDHFKSTQIWSGCPADDDVAKMNRRLAEIVSEVKPKHPEAFKISDHFKPMQAWFERATPDSGGFTDGNTYQLAIKWNGRLIQIAMPNGERLNRTVELEVPSEGGESGPLIFVLAKSGKHFFARRPGIGEMWMAARATKAVTALYHAWLDRQKAKFHAERVEKNISPVATDEQWHRAILDNDNSLALDAAMTADLNRTTGVETLTPGPASAMLYQPPVPLKRIP